ncbi:type II toxin-antitoxin system RelE/ParE family toxin [Candidatus Woesearchaeota archaeon]|nr:type II toxin-antitoxin system RelE/ParE family toxin [Candidatus Woesearchaeota archaeon]
MVEVVFDDNFRRYFKKIKSQSMKMQIISQIEKIRENPETGKPMRFSRKGTRELYISPYRLSYTIKEGIIYILDLYHKDNQ